ncbi:MAG: TonB-dependent receptor [Pseudomonadota bacterium]
MRNKPLIRKRLSICIGMSFMLTTSHLNAQTPSDSASVAVSLQSYDLDIAAQPLNRALIELAAVTGIQILYTTTDTADINAPALIGEFSVEQALNTLLRNADMTFRRTAENTITLEVRPAISAESRNSYFVLDAITVSASTVDQDESTTIFQVTPSVTRSGVPIEDMSRSVQVYNANFIEDFQPVDLAEVITMTSNVAFFGKNSVSRRPLFLGRGFFTPILKDGASGDYASYETYNMERIEVLKGPDSINFGVAEPGGLINLVSKKPKAERHGEVIIDYNSNPGYTLKTDFGGPTQDGGALKYRIVGVYGDNDSFKDFSNSEEKFFIAPSLSYEFNENHTLTVWAEHLDLETYLLSGFVIGSDGRLPVPSDTIVGHPDNMMKNKQTAYGIDLNSTFGSWVTSLKYKHDSFKTNLGDGLAPFNYVEPVNAVVRISGRFNSTEEVDMIIFTANNAFELAGVTHRLSIGLDYRERQTKDYNLTFDFAGAAFLSLDNPVYETTIPTTPVVPDTIFSPSRQKGVFIQDHITLYEDIILSMGLRYTDFSPSDSNLAPAGDDTSEVTPQIGVLYKLNPSVSVYANYAESFNPVTARDINGEQLDPTTGEGFEIGLKYNYNDFLNISTSVFDISKVNVPQLDPADPLGQASISSGEQVSQGFELDIIGDITENWSVVASYGFLDTEDKDRMSAVTEFGGFPKHSANLHTTYRLSGFGLPDVRVGGGARYLGTMFADTSDANTIKTEAVLVLNASMSYDYGPWSATLSVKNLTDKEYFTNAKGTIPIFVQVGEPRTAYLTVKYDFL